MALKLVNIGTSVNSKDGDVLRTAFDKINQNFTELYNSTGGNADTGDYVFNGGNLYNPVGAVDIWSGPFAGPYNGELYLDANGVLLLSNNERNQWQFNNAGTLAVPHLLPITFTATLDIDHCTSNPNLSLTSEPWYYSVTFAVNPNGSVEIQIDGNRVWNTLPNYPDGSTFDFTEADHGIPNYTLTITFISTTNTGHGWAASNLTCTVPPTYPSTVESEGAIKLTSNNNSWVFGTDGTLTLPVGGDIVDSNGDTVLGGTGGASVSTGDTPPSSHATGDLWYDSVGGRMYIYYDSNWIDSSPETVVPPFDSLVNGEYTFQVGVDGTVNLPVASTSTSLIQSTSHIQLNANGKTWSFATNGVLTIPENGDIRNSTGTSVLGGANTGVIRFNSNVIYTAASQNLVINPSNDSNNKIVVPGAGNGGSFPLSLTNTEGNITLTANTKNWIFNTDGSTTMPASGDTVLNGGNLYFGAVASGSKMYIDNGFNLQIYTNTGGQRSGNWIFGTNGSTTFPNGAKLDNGVAYKFATDNSVTQYIDLRDTSGRGFYTDGSGYTLRSSGSKSWIFDTDGKLTFPDSTVQTTGYQTASVPGTSKGVSGNKAGMVAFDNSNFYYCKQNYTDGIDDIWVKVAWTSVSW